MRALLLPVGPDSYAVDVMQVREVVTAPTVEPLPTAPASVLGLFNLRGEILPLLDTAALLGLGTVGAPAYVAVVETALGPAGLCATGPPQFVDLGEPVQSDEGRDALYRVGAGVAVLLDVDGLLTPARLGGWAG